MPSIHGCRGRQGDPISSAKRILHTGVDLLTDKQTGRLHSLFAVDEHVEVRARDLPANDRTYREPNHVRGGD